MQSSVVHVVSLLPEFKYQIHLRAMCEINRETHHTHWRIILWVWDVAEEEFSLYERRP